VKNYKIINKEMKHRGMVYKEGLNILGEEFNPYDSCASGGLYFAREDILAFMDYGDLVFEVKLLPDSLVYEEPLECPKKWKTNKFNLSNRRELNLETIKDLIEEGANAHVYSERPLRSAVRLGNLELVKFFVEQGADIHVFKDAPLKRASEYGHLEIVKYLIEKGAHPHIEGDLPLRLASSSQHKEVVNFFKEITENEGR
jgi:hypothetical protein